jgi:phosphatidylinositol glycan class Q protein
MRVLGVVNPQTPFEQFDTHLLATYTDTPTRFPRLLCPVDSGLMVQIIMYDRPHPTRMQYISLSPISLALDDKSEMGKSDPLLESIEAEEAKERESKSKLVEKMKLHTVISHPPTQKELSLQMIVDQINCSFELDAVLQKNIGLIGRRTKRALSVSERVVESANNLWDYVYMAISYFSRVWIYPILMQLFTLGLIAHRTAGEALLRVLEWRFRPWSPALKDISATAQQVDIRLQQFCYWPLQYLTLRKRKANWESITNSHPEYIRFYNSLWLVANDVIIGIALGSYIIENSAFVASQMDMVFNTWSVEGLRRMILWLMEWPGGLKLNTELAEFLGDLFLWVIDHWAGAFFHCKGNIRQANVW